MRKPILIFTLLLALTTAVFAQSKQPDISTMSLALDGGVPLSKFPFNEDVKSVIGAALKFDIRVVSQTAITLSFGYSHIPHPEYEDEDFNYIPLKIGVKRHFAENFYAELQTGAAIPTSDDQKTHLILSPGLGYFIFKNLDLGLRYEGWLYNSTGSEGFDGGIRSTTEHLRAFSQLAFRLSYTL